MLNRNKIALVSLFVLTSCLSFAQATAAETEANDAMRGNGKIYVVMAVVLTILAGLVFYLVRLDRKISKLEKGNV